MQFEPAETPAEATLRVVREAAAALLRERQRLLRERSQAPLTGDSSAVGQGQLFEADLLSGVSALDQEAAYRAKLKNHKTNLSDL